MSSTDAAIRGIGAYQPRAVSFRGMVERDGWRIKTYLIDATDGAQSNAIFERALSVAPFALPDADINVLGLASHGFAIVTLHCGRLANWLLVNWWVGGSILQQRLFRSEITAPVVFHDVSAHGLVACVWEFGVIDFERRAWIETMMGPNGPNSEDYLAAQLSGNV